MISTTHITAGAALGLAIGSAIPEPALAIPVALVIGLISHHLLDAIPHTDTGSFRLANDKSIMNASESQFALPDNIIATLFVLWIFFSREASWPMLFGAIGGNFPDVFHHTPKWGHWTRENWKAYFKFHETLHFTARGSLIPLGILTNLFIIWLSVRYLLIG